MKKADSPECLSRETPPIDLQRRTILRGMMALGGAMALGGCATGSQMGAEGSRMAGGRIVVRWLGGGVVELATPD
jgi:hypothetical protein